MNPIEIRRLTKTFGDVVALRELSLTVAEGELFGLVGPDGAGKTTTMRLLSAILDPTSGDAWVAGFHIVNEAEAVKEHIGYMSQRFGLYPDLTVLENIEFYADIYGVARRGREEKIERLLGFANLTAFRHRLAGALSGGMKQKLGLACALVHRPEVLLLDEPTVGVDPQLRVQLWNGFRAMAAGGTTIIVSSHVMDEAERCDRLGMIRAGRLLAEGSAADLLALTGADRLEDAFLTLAEGTS